MDNETNTESKAKSWLRELLESVLPAVVIVLAGANRTWNTAGPIVAENRDLVSRANARSASSSMPFLGTRKIRPNP